MKDSEKSPYDVSIIIPVMNEDENIEILADEVNRAMAHYDGKWECLWIDDYSTDTTRDKLKEICEQHPCHSYLFHKANYGQSAALVTGFRHSTGKILVTLDGDGQNDPADIPRLLQTLQESNADMVNGRRKKRQDNLIRKISSRIANKFRNTLTGENVSDVGCALRCFKRECVDNIVVFKGMHRFFPTLVKLAGHQKIIEEPVKHRSRERGKTKYGINNRLWVGIVDTLAVCWMRRRLVFPGVSENKGENQDHD